MTTLIEILIFLKAIRSQRANTHHGLISTYATFKYRIYVSSRSSRHQSKYLHWKRAHITKLLMVKKQD